MKKTNLILILSLSFFGIPLVATDEPVHATVEAEVETFLEATKTWLDEESANHVEDLKIKISDVVGIAVDRLPVFELCQVAWRLQELSLAQQKNSKLLFFELRGGDAFIGQSFCDLFFNFSAGFHTKDEPLINFFNIKPKVQFASVEEDPYPLFNFLLNNKKVLTTKAWECSGCTLLNSGLLSSCAVCSTEKSSPTDVVEGHFELPSYAGAAGTGVGAPAGGGGSAGAGGPLSSSAVPVSSLQLPSSTLCDVRTKIMSPVCLGYSLLMLSLFASDSARAEISRALKLITNNADLSLNNIHQAVAGNDSVVTIRLANVFCSGYSRKAELVGWGNECGAESLFVDLSRLTDIISDINRFTSRAIPEILEGFAAEDFTKERISSLVVTALNFSGKWREPFPGEQTKTASFRNYNNKISTVNMMSDNDYTARTIKYTLMPEQETYVELPYKTESYYLQCYLPPENDFINFSGCDWSKLNTAAENKIKVSLPKGKIVGESVDLAPLLKDLGVNQVFSAGGLETLDARCFLNKFIHATSVTFDDSRPKFLADDSKPTDSASAETCPEIIFNRPFMFRIVYTGIPDKGCIVIAEGRVLTSEDLMKI